MEGIVFKSDEDLKDTDLTMFKDGFGKLMEFIYKQVSTIIGTKKVFSKDIIKKILVDESKEDSFPSKVSMNKSRIGNFSINMFTQSPNGVTCILWKKEYLTKEDFEQDIKYLVDNLDKIKPEDKTQEVI